MKTNKQKTFKAGQFSAVSENSNQSELLGRYLGATKYIGTTCEGHKWWHFPLQHHTEDKVTCPEDRGEKRQEEQFWLKKEQRRQGLMESISEQGKFWGKGCRRGAGWSLLPQIKDCSCHKSLRLWSGGYISVWWKQAKGTKDLQENKTSSHLITRWGTQNFPYKIKCRP